MKVIYKQEISSGSEINLPIGSCILMVDVQKGSGFMWYLFDKDNADETEPRKINIFGTGQEIPSSYTYINTFFDGPFVWHAFELNE